MTTRDTAIKELKTSLDWLEQGINFPDSVVWTFIYYITELSDADLLNLAPAKIKNLVLLDVKKYQETGSYVCYNSKGEEVDHSERMHKLSKLLEEREFE
jgi:hypothetical protein